jgi:hypothetical protein
MNAQNKIFSIPITSVTWSISVPTNSTYNGASQSVTVVSVSPVGATYSTSTTSATNAGSVASTTITGTGIYTGSFTSPNLTIVRATPTIEFQFFFSTSTGLYSADVRVTDPLSSGVGIAYSDNTPYGPAGVANLTTTFQNTGGIYNRFTTYSWSTSQTTNWATTSGSFTN